MPFPPEESMMPDKANAEADGSGGPRRRERHLSPTHAVLWTVILVGTGGTLLTMTGLSVGLRNVVVSTMLAEFGLVKFGAMRWLVAGWRLLSERNATVSLALLAVVTLAAVPYDAVTILQYRGVITAATGI